MFARAYFVEISHNETYVTSKNYLFIPFLIEYKIDYIVTCIGIFLIKTDLFSCSTTVTSSSTIEVPYNTSIRKRVFTITADYACLHGDKSTTQENDEQHLKRLDHFHQVSQANSGAGRRAIVHISLDHRDSKIKIALLQPRDVQHHQSTTQRPTSTEKYSF